MIIYMKIDISVYSANWILFQENILHILLKEKTGTKYTGYKVFMYVFMYVS